VFFNTPVLSQYIGGFTRTVFVELNKASGLACGFRTVNIFCFTCRCCRKELLLNGQNCADGVECLFFNWSVLEDFHNVGELLWKSRDDAHDQVSLCDFIWSLFQLLSDIRKSGDVVRHGRSGPHHGGVETGKGSDACRLGCSSIVSFAEGFLGSLRIAISEAIEKCSNAGFS